MLDRNRASILGLGTVQATSPGGQFFVDTPVVQAGKHWIIQKSTIWIVGDTHLGGPSPDLGASGIFVCPPGSPENGVPIGALRAPSLIDWWNDGLQTDDNGNGSADYDVPFVLPSGWWLRFIWSPTGSDPINAGTQLLAAFMYEIEDNC